MALDPNRTYTAAEVQGLLNAHLLSEVRTDLERAIELGKQTAQNVEQLSQELHTLKDTVQSLLTADLELGVNSMSASERAAMPGAVRAYLAGQRSVQGREKLWQRTTAIVFVIGGALSILSVFGFVSWFRVHVLHLSP